MRPIQIKGGQVLTDGALEKTDVTLADGVIAEIGTPGPADALGIDASGLVVLPGIVDVHGDSFERQIMPRPGIHFDHAIALTETDRQLATNGITTAYHGLTLSWEPGLRSVEAGRRFVDALDRARASLTVDHRIQLRWETFAFEAADLVIECLGRSPLPALAFNDHTSMTGRKLEQGQHAKLAEWAKRAELSVEDYLSLFNRVWAHKSEVPGAIEDLARSGRKAGAVMLSHDDLGENDRVWYRGLGADVAEFPLALPAARNARDAGEHAVFGSPNVVRGGSHVGSLSAVEMVHAGLCTVLASDYYYPAMTAAVRRLVQQHDVGLPCAWDLVSRAPAEAMRLNDRGRIETGLRADIVLADLSGEHGVRVETTISGGRIAYLNGHQRLAA